MGQKEDDRERADYYDQCVMHAKFQDDYAKDADLYATKHQEIAQHSTGPRRAYFLAAHQASKMQAKHFRDLKELYKVAAYNLSDIKRRKL